MVEHGTKRLLAGNIPKPRLTFPAAKCADASSKKLAAIGAEAELRNRKAVFQGRPERLTGCNIPEADRAIGVTGRKHPAVGRNPHRANDLVMLQDRAARATCGSIPKLAAGFSEAGGQHPTVRAEDGHWIETVFLPDVLCDPAPHLAAGLNVPEPPGLTIMVLPERDAGLIVRAENEFRRRGLGLSNWEGIQRREAGSELQPGGPPLRACNHEMPAVGAQGDIMRLQ